MEAQGGSQLLLALAGPETPVNHSDIFRLRSSIVEIVEDLKLRQVEA